MVYSYCECAVLDVTFSWTGCVTATSPVAEEVTSYGGIYSYITTLIYQLPQPASVLLSTRAANPCDGITVLDDSRQPELQIAPDTTWCFVSVSILHPNPGHPPRSEGQEQVMLYTRITSRALMVCDRLKAPKAHIRSTLIPTRTARPTLIPSRQTAGGAVPRSRPAMTRMRRQPIAHLRCSSLHRHTTVCSLHTSTFQPHSRSLVALLRVSPVMASNDSTPVEAFHAASSSTAPTTTIASTQSISTASSSQPQSVQPSNLVVHHLNNSRSQRILWLLEELQVPYTIKRYQRTSADLAPPELLAVHPLGKSPVITDNGRTVAESGAIVDYIIELYGADRFTVNEFDERLSANYWSHFAEGSVMPPLTMLQVFKAVREKTPWGVRFIAAAITHAVETSYINPTVQKQFDYIEQTLKANRAKGSDFFVGRHLTAADFMMLFPLEAVAAAGGRGAGPTLGSETKQWVGRMHARDAYKRALQKGGEYAYAK